MDYELIQGDCLAVLQGLEACTVQTCVTSPPYYGLRDYGHDGQIGLERTPEEYVAKLVDVFREVRRVLRDDGTLWCNLGDSYSGSGGEHKEHHNSTSGFQYKNKERELKKGRQPIAVTTGLKPKDLIGIPWMVAFALRADGWYLRSDIIWHKPNPMPESVTDRPTKAHEYIFLLSKSERYFYDADAIKERATVGHRGTDFMPTSKKDKLSNGMGSAATKASLNGRTGEWSDTRNRRSVWTVATRPYSGAHFATFPPDLIEPCILAGSKVGDTVLDPFNGSGTTGAVALRYNRRYVGIDLNPDYLELAHRRIRQAQPMLLESA